MGSITMETTAHRPSRESNTPDFDQAASRPVAKSHIRARAARADLSDDPIPLFLSDPLGAPDPLEYAPLELRPRIRVVQRVFATVLALSTLAIPVALFRSDLRRLLTADVRTDAAPLEIAAPVGPPAARQASLEDPARVTNAMLASADSRKLPASSTPNREAIATAYQIALQAQAPAPVAAQPEPPPPAKIPVRTLDADTLAGLMARANSLLAVGDIVAARLLLERAANAPDATAAFLLAQTHDPAVLGTSDARSISADTTAARDWYRKAASLGSTEARQRLARFQN
jgi:hypothetical protein